VSRARKRAGQSLVETALILAAFMGLLLGMTGVGELVFVRQTLADRARQAARWGALNPYDPAKIRDMAQFGNIAASDIEVSNPGCPGLNCRILVAIPTHGIRVIETAGETVGEPVTAPPAASKP
jgi:Flp pilus assembly protein TadG